MTKPLENSFDDIAARRSFEDMVLPLYLLFGACARSGLSAIEGKTFTKCRVEGPAVMLCLEGVQFDGCNMGPSRGDTKNLLLRPVGQTVAIGAIPVRQTRFVSCDFIGVGFTGNDDFLRMFEASVTSERDKA